MSEEKKLPVQVNSPDILNWVAVYDSGLQVCEVSGVAYADLDRSKLREFWLVNTQGVARVKIALALPERRLIFRRRRVAKLNGQIVSTTYIIGYYELVHEKPQYSLLYIHPNGVVEVDNHRNDLELQECER